MALAEPAVPGALAELAALVAQEALAELAVPEALAGLVVQVVELELNRVEGPELVQVAVELARGQAAGVPERDPVAVPLRTKSVIAAHHRDLVPLLAGAEDLAAAVAETTREPAATEAATAWEAVGTVAAAEAAA